MAIEQVKIPDIGGAKNVDVIEVFIKVGDRIAKDASLITLEGDKATMEVPASLNGVIKEVTVKVGDKVSEGTVIAQVETESETAAKESAAKPKQESETKKQPEPATAEKPASAQKTEASQPAKKPSEAPLEEEAEEEDIHAGPGVRRLAREFGLELNQIHGSGPKNRILKEDLQNYVKQKIKAAQGAGGLGITPAPEIDFRKFGEIETKPLSKIKKISGPALHRNWVTIPHVTQFGEADVTEMEQFRIQQKAMVDGRETKLTPLVLVMKAVVAALKEFPIFNASLAPNGEQLVLKKYFHIGVAVDTPNGLVVPVIQNVDKKGLFSLAVELAQMSKKARETGLSMTDMQGGCFTISSLGGIGGTAFTPIINAPEVAILGVSRTQTKPVYDQDSGQWQPRLKLPLSLSYDHRVIDGADGARFMVYLTSRLSDIRTLLL
ncbi:MAG: dihydrolipoyllysine-residue acetyltransferase [Proteobacteria bacterium]|nr:dihydrolipoyllysine-residue acetyltransferase [Pseudomonadota bacterium]